MKGGVKGGVNREPAAPVAPVSAVQAVPDASPPGPEQRPRVRVLGTPVDAATMAEAVEAAGVLVERGRPSMIVTTNPELIMHAQGDPELGAILDGADLVVPDGIGVVWAARLLGHRVPERVPGVELTEALLALAAARGYRVYFLGAAEGVAVEAAARLTSRFPGLTVAGTHHGYFGQREEPRIIAEIRAAAPHILFVAMGAPRQEKWIARNLRECGVPLCMGIGGSLDVFAGRVQRAPGWVQAAGLEWLYRLVRQPSRARRMLALPRFAVRVLLDAARRNLL